MHRVGFGGGSLLLVLPAGAAGHSAAAGMSLTRQTTCRCSAQAGEGQNRKALLIRLKTAALTHGKRNRRGAAGPVARPTGAAVRTSAGRRCGMPALRLHNYYHYWLPLGQIGRLQAQGQPETNS